MSPDCIYTPLPLADPFVVDGAPPPPPEVYELAPPPLLRTNAETEAILDGRASPCELFKSNRSKRHMKKSTIKMERLNISTQYPVETAQVVRVKTLPNLRVKVNTHLHRDIEEGLTEEEIIARCSIPDDVPSVPRTREILVGGAKVMALQQVLVLRQDLRPDSPSVRPSAMYRTNYSPYVPTPSYRTELYRTGEEYNAFHAFLMEKGLDGDNISDEDWLANVHEYLHPEEFLPSKSKTL